jgi:hypothetical protein
MYRWWVGCVGARAEAWSVDVGVLFGAGKCLLWLGIVGGWTEIHYVC